MAFAVGKSPGVHVGLRFGQLGDASILQQRILRPGGPHLPGSCVTGEVTPVYRGRGSCPTVTPLRSLTCRPLALCTAHVHASIQSADLSTVKDFRS